MGALLVGNDVVDLRDPDVEPSSYAAGFVGRVCSPGERALLARSSDPRALLWRLWSAKEAAFKAITRVVPDQIFCHARFAVDVAGQRVCFEGYRLSAQWQQVGDGLHCQVLSEVSGRRPRLLSACCTLDEIVPGPGDRVFRHQEASASSRESRAVRILARRLLASHLGLRREDLEVRRRPSRRHHTGRTPPEVWYQGSPVPGVTASLSHHGRYVGCTLMVC
jgi:phosphopantetheinyl transferase (holo-ACP synthase)